MGDRKKFVFWRKLTGDLVEDNFSAKPEYHAFFSLCNGNFDFRIATNSESYKGGGVFANVSLYKDWKILPAEKDFRADVIYQRKKLTDINFDKAVPIVDSPEFKEWCPDKWNQYQALSEFMPKSFLVRTEKDFNDYLCEMKTLKCVLKPRKGEKGEGVVVFERNLLPKLDENILKTKGYILQEFHDTNIDVPGIVSGIHDLKLITIDDDVFANLRVPESGKEFCTFDSPYTELPFQKLPKSVIDLHKKVKEKIANLFPDQLYTVDVGITSNGPIVFELNSHTAFPYLHFNYAQDFFNAVISHIKSMAPRR